MIRVPVRLGLLALPALLGCDLSAPVWSADFFFPIDYPDVELEDYAVGGQIPDTDMAFSSSLVQQDITGLLEEMLSDDLVALTLEVITDATVDITASLTLNIAAADSLLVPIAASRSGTRSPSQSISVQLAAALGVDTMTVVVDPGALRDAIALYYQTEGVLRGAPGGTSVGPGDRIKVDVNLLATYQVSR